MPALARAASAAPPFAVPAAAAAAAALARAPAAAAATAAAASRRASVRASSMPLSDTTPRARARPAGAPVARASPSSADAARRRLLNLGLATRPYHPAPVMAAENKREFACPPPATDNATILHRKIFGGRTLVLNRPKALNALSLEMIRSITSQLKVWDASSLCKIVIMTSSSSPRAFCAGGDVKTVVALAKDGREAEALKFFEEEYQLNHLIATLSKPYVAILDGITMGGGVGLSVHGTFRIATENTVFAMPETAIGLFPDVGGSFFLPRMDGELGTYLGLTGQRLKGADVFYAGIATHFVPSQRIGALVERLCELENDNPDVVNLTIEEFSEMPTAEPLSAVDGPDRVAIDSCFACNSVEGIIENLKGVATDFSGKTIQQLESMSPLSLKLTLAVLREGKMKSLRECLQMEFHLVSLLLNGGGDFAEGVKAMLVDKREPKWNPSRLANVSDEWMRAQYFIDLNNPKLGFLRSVDFTSYPHRRFSGPSEDDVRRIVEGSSRASGANAWNEQDVEQYFAKASHWKHGVREKVRRIIDRKCVVDAEGWLNWEA